MIYKFFYLIIFFSLLNCSKKGQNKHPDPNKLPGKEIIANFVDLNAPGKQKPPFSFKKSDLKKLYKLSQTNDNFDESLINIKKVLIDKTGSSYLTNNHTNSIYVFNNLGQFIYKIGRSGSGPGEFNQIKTFDFTSDFKMLFVLDQNEVEIFSLENERYVPYKTIFHGLSFSNDLCLLGNTLFLQGFKIEKSDSSEQKKSFFSNVSISKPLHEYDYFNENIISSFGFLYESFSGSPVIDAMLSDQFIACNNTNNTITTSLKNFGYFFGYNGEGERKWISKIDNFRPNGIEELNINSPNAGIRFNSEKDYYHSLMPFGQTNTEYLIMQMSSIPGKSFEKTNLESINNTQIRPHTFFLNTSNGQIIYSDSFYSRFSVRNFGKILTIEHKGTIIGGNSEVWINENNN